MLKDGVKKGALEARSAAATYVGRKSYRRYAILRTRSREASEANSRLHQLAITYSDISPRRPSNPRRIYSDQFETYGVIIAPGLGECRWRPFRTNRRKRQPVLAGFHVVDDWTSAQWPFRPQYVLSDSIDMTTADLRNRPVYYQHWRNWIACFISNRVGRNLFAYLRLLLTGSRFGAVYMICAVGVYV
jgi:hypothetical protein